MFDVNTQQNRKRFLDLMICRADGLRKEFPWKLIQINLVLSILGGKQIHFH